MPHPKKQKNSSKSVIKLLEDGPITIKSNTKSHQVDTTNTYSLPPTKNILSTAEFPVPNKNPTSTGKSNSCKKNSPTIKSSATSEVESISKKNDFSPFYHKSSASLFRELWFPQMIDLPDLTVNFLAGFTNNPNVNSYALTSKKKNLMSKNLINKICLSLPFSPPDIMENENTMATRKIRIFPSQEQIVLFNKCFGATRYIYNQTLECIKKEYSDAKKKLVKQSKKGCVHMIKTRVSKKYGSKTAKKNVLKQCCQKLSTKYFCNKHKKCKLKYNISYNFQHWRNLMIKPNAELDDDKKWLNEIPYDTRQLVIKNILGNYKSALTNKRNGNIKKFDLKFKSRKNKNQFFFVDHRALKPSGILWEKKFDHKLKMRKGESKWFNNFIKNNTLKDMIITREYPGKYYLHIPYEQQEKKITSKRKMASIDPGVRIFHTGYDPQGSVIIIGEKLGDHIIKIYEKVDQLQSKIKKTNTKNNDEGYKKNKRSRQRMKKQCAWLRAKIKGIVNDHHWKTASYYCKNYQIIIIPKLDTKSLKRKIKQTYGSTIASKMIRKMMSLAHSRFIDILKYMAKQYNRELLIVDEAYTSVTCGKCGILHKNLYSKKVYHCQNCKMIIDRDINGARNILINSVHRSENLTE
jgi:IS605 OrfB family transposase